MDSVDVYLVSNSGDSRRTRGSYSSGSSTCLNPSKILAADCSY